MNISIIKKIFYYLIVVGPMALQSCGLLGGGGRGGSDQGELVGVQGDRGKWVMTVPFGSFNSRRHISYGTSR